MTIIEFLRVLDDTDEVTLASDGEFMTGGSVKELLEDTEFPFGCEVVSIHAVTRNDFVVDYIMK